jgi:glycosyltransferase involved in cell wall biosynthesis
MPHRAEMFCALYNKLKYQILCSEQPMQVQLLWDDDTKLTTGKKRNNLLNQASGDFIVFVDDDDDVDNNYVDEILKVIIENPNIDCIGINGLITFDGDKGKPWSISIKHGHWHETDEMYLRTPNHISPVRRSIALKAKFPDISYGEDMEYSKRILPMCKKEACIDKPLYHYKYISVK